jgi:hypothetical protein
MRGEFQDLGRENMSSLERDWSMNWTFVILLQGWDKALTSYILGSLRCNLVSNYLFQARRTIQETLVEGYTDIPLKVN